MSEGLERFVDAQAPIYARVEAELRAGRKRTHWMWFVFPQLRGLGASPMALRFGIASLAEARAYLGHPVLATRLHACTQIVVDVADRGLFEIFGSPDDMKFRSSMTLFSIASGETPGRESVFAQALDRFCDGALDERTLALLDSDRSGA